jgi:hypothetical protein
MNPARRSAIALLALGLLASAASLFGPRESIGGVDAGATGTAIFAGVIAATVWLFAKRGEHVFPEHMSIAERRAWVGLAFALVVVASFARHFWAMSSHELPPETFRDPIGRHFVQQLLMLLVSWTLIARLIGRQAGAVEVDERDLRLLDRAHSAGDFTLTLIVIACIVVLAFVPMTLLEWWLAPIALVYVLIGMLIAKSLVEQVVLALAYRSKPD